MKKPDLPPLLPAIAAHEEWMRGRITVVEDDLKEKHRLMAGSAFAFLRATCFRFADIVPLLTPDVLDAPLAPSCGDAHLENFGTWRDAEGRLVWGVNDLDEAAMLPWTLDLARLATSALLARDKHKALSARDIATALLDGYAQGIATPCPFVLDEHHARLRDHAVPTVAERAAFWAKLRALPAATAIPEGWEPVLRAALPGGAEAPRYLARGAGLGSRGRPRILVLAEWSGGPVAREMKATLPSAWLPRAADAPNPCHAAPVADGVFDLPRYRVPDPWWRRNPAYTIRRLAPDNRKIEAEGDADSLLHLLNFMGAELANLHAAGGAGRAIMGDLRTRPGGWLHDAAEVLAEAVTVDWTAWVARGL